MASWPNNKEQPSCSRRHKVKYIVSLKKERVNVRDDEEENGEEKYVNDGMILWDDEANGNIDLEYGDEVD